MHTAERRFFGSTALKPRASLSLIETHLLLMAHIWVVELGQHWFRYYRVACWVPSLYVNKREIIVNWTLKTKKWRWNWNYDIFINKNAVTNAVCVLAVILSQSQYVKGGKVSIEFHLQYSTVSNTDVSQCIHIPNMVMQSIVGYQYD